MNYHTTDNYTVSVTDAVTDNVTVSVTDNFYCFCYITISVINAVSVTDNDIAPITDNVTITEKMCSCCR